MTTFSKVFLSESVNGRGIPVAATATPGTLIHTAHATALDELWIWAQCTGTSAQTLKIEWGSANATENIWLGVPAGTGLHLVVPGLVVSASLKIRAFAGEANAVTLHGFINRINS